MYNAVYRATRDPDGQAAGKEYRDLKKFATENWDRMAPNAKAKFRVYERHAKASQAKGRTGIRSSDYRKMLNEMGQAGYKDKSAGAAIEGLKSHKGQISGKVVQKAIINGTKDFDGQAAGKEYADLKKFAQANWSRLSSDGKEKFRVYEKYAKAAQAQGHSGIARADYARMVNEMRNSGYRDASSGRAIESLKNNPGSISGEAMHNAIVNGTKDGDSQAAGNEYVDFKKFASENWDRMSPNAREKFRVYEKVAKRVQKRGKTGIPSQEYKEMVRQMKAASYHDASAARAIETLKSTSGSISAGAMQRAIFEGTQDLDNSAASTEHADFKKFAQQNWHRMSPGAKEKFRVYDAYAQSSKARGLTGIPQEEYQAMKWQMRSAGYHDASAGQAIEALKAKTGLIDAKSLIGAIARGTIDADGQAAGREYADFSNYAFGHWNQLTPDAKAAFMAYTAHAENAWLDGSTGISNFGGMIQDMKAAAELLFLRQGFFRI